MLPTVAACSVPTDASYTATASGSIAASAEVTFTCAESYVGGEPVTATCDGATGLLSAQPPACSPAPKSE